MALSGHKNGEFSAPLAETVEIIDGSSISENLPEVNRPPLRRIDKLIRPQIPFLSARTTVALLSCIGFIILTGQKIFIFDVAYNVNYYELQSPFSVFKVIPYVTLVGYLIGAISSGLLATVYPANKLFGAVIAVSSIQCFCVAIAYPHINAYGSVVITFIMGLSEGAIYPAFIGTMSHWAPPLERTQLTTLALSGPYAGICLSWLIYLGEHSFVCYLYGATGILWCLLWLWLVFEKPAYHTCIDTKELKLIESSLAKDHKKYISSSLKDIPWKAIFTSKPVYALVVASYCSSCSYKVLFSIQNIYFDAVYNSTIAQWYRVVLFGIMALTIIFGGVVADWLQRRKKQTLSEIRILFVSGGFGMEVIFVLILAFTGTYYNLGLTIYSMALICGIITISGIEVNHLDIAPRYAAFLLGLTNSVTALTAYKYTYALNKLVINKDPYNYKFAFLLMVLVYFIGAIFYGIFGTGQQQQWAKPKLKEEEKRTSLNEVSGWRTEVM